MNLRAFQTGAAGDQSFLDPSQYDSYSIARGQAATFTHASLSAADAVKQDSGSRDTVVQTTAGDACHGIIIQAGTTTSCVVQRSGVTPELFSDLAIGSTYYTAASGGISTSGSNVVGVGWTDTRLRLTLPDVTGVLSEVTSFGDLDDVTPSSPASGQRVEYNGSVYVNAWPDDLRDADGDTLVQVEESADEDIIRFDAGGSQIAAVTTTGLGVGTASPDRLLHAEVADAGTTSTVYGVRVSHATSGTAAVGIGIGYEFEVEADDGTMDVIAAITAESVDATGGAAEGKLVFSTLDEGDDGLASRMEIDDSGTVTITAMTTAGFLKNTTTGVVSGGNIVDQLEDADGDTLVQVEESGDEDTIRFDCAGSEIAVITATGLGAGTASPDTLIHAETADAGTTTTTYGIRVSHATSGTAAAGLGAGYQFEAEAADGNMDVIASISAELTDATGGAAESKFVIRTLDEGDDGLASRLEVDKDGILTALGGYKSADGSAGLTGTLELDDGANWNATLTFKNGLLVGQTTGASSAATATWT